MTSTAPLEVLIAGAGVAGLETALALHAIAGDRVHVTLLDPGDAFSLRAMTVAEPFAAGRADRHPLPVIAQDAGARLVRETLAGVDAGAHVAHTGSGGELPYDALVLALGARHEPAFARATTFRPDDTDLLSGLLRDIDEGYSRRVAVLIPDAPHWPLPAYELALLVAREAQGMGIGDFRLTVVTPEREPLGVFGAAAAAAVRGELERHGIALETAARPVVRGGDPTAVELGDGRVLDVDRVLALPRLVARPVPGIPANADGFMATDQYGRVHGVPDVYAAGDGTTFPVKQGGIAAQQADVIAEHLAARAGADVTPQPFRPVLRGRLLTGGTPRYLRHDPTEPSDGRASEQPLWWPPAKVAGRHLAPYLAARDARTAALVQPPAGGTPVDAVLEDVHPAPAG